MHQRADTVSIDPVVGSGLVDGLIEVEVVLVDVGSEVYFEPG